MVENFDILARYERQRQRVANTPIVSSLDNHTVRFVLKPWHVWQFVNMLVKAAWNRGETISCKMGKTKYYFKVR